MVFAVDGTARSQPSFFCSAIAWDAQTSPAYGLTARPQTPLCGHLNAALAILLSCVGDGAAKLFELNNHRLEAGGFDSRLKARLLG